MSLEDLPAMVELNVTHVRIYAKWSALQPKLDEIETNITVDMFRKDPSLIDNWAKTVSWNGKSSVYGHIFGIISRILISRMAMILLL